LEDAEAAVKSHQTFQDAYDKCCAWIRATTDKLAACFEGHNEKEKSQANIDEIEVVQFFSDMIVSKLCCVFIVYIDIFSQSVYY